MFPNQHKVEETGSLFPSSSKRIGWGVKGEHLLFSVHISSIDGCSGTVVIHISACGLSAFFHLMLLFSTSLSGVILGLRVYSNNFGFIFSIFSH